MSIKQPVKHKIAKTPVVMQLEALECGAASLTMILGYFEKWIPLEQVRSDCGVSRDGSNARNIVRAAQSYGLVCKAYKLEPEEVADEATFPCIVHWDFNHFIVVKGFKGKYVYINDPARGEVRITMDEFDRGFTGICITFEPGENFVPEGKKKGALDYVKERFKGLGTMVAFVVLSTCISSLLSVISPGFNRIFYDRLLTGQNPEWVRGFLIAFAGLAFLQVVISYIRTLYNFRINGKMDVVGSSTFMWKILRLPMEFYSQRMAGDILSRQNSNASIANTLVETIAPLFLNTIMMVFYFIVMIRYNVVLTIVALVSTLTNMVVSRFIAKKRINATRVAVRDSGKLYGTTMAGIEMIETIKASGSENGFFERWAGYQASSNEGDVKYSLAGAYLGLIPNIVSLIATSTITGIGLYLTMKGDFTLGMISAFQGYLSGFTAPVSSLISASQTIQEMTTDIERIDDVMKYPDDEVFNAKASDENADYSKLSGRVELKNVTFGYAKLADPLIKDFSMSLKPGSRVAFVGSSGCGKSTLSKLISGLVQPWSGEILFDGKPMSEIDRSVFTSSLAVVDQDIIIFEDSIKDNIKMWDDSIEDFEVVLAARDAQIHSDIMQRQDGFDYKLTEGGKDFSGGQRQRMEIARVLAQDPTICILDEATSALDAKTEYEVIKAIKDRGITTIIVAHRLSTIRDCDEIIVLDHGEVVERGTHDELMALNGRYTQLITSE